MEAKIEKTFTKTLTITMNEDEESLLRHVFGLNVTIPEALAGVLRIPRHEIKEAIDKIYNVLVGR